MLTQVGLKFSTGYVLLSYLFLITCGSDIFNQQPRIISVGGNVIFQTAEHRNITFKSVGTGSIRINDDDLISIAQTVRQSATELNRLKSESLVTLEQRLQQVMEQLSSVESFEQRLSQLEILSTRLSSTINNLTRTRVILFRRMTRNKNQIRTVTNRLNSIRVLLNEDDCLSNPCRNGGVCEDGYGKYICRCPDNWQGVTCEEDANECFLYTGTPLGCQNGATCSNTPGSFSCQCSANWYGVLCNEKHDDCTGASSQALCGHGLCHNVERILAGQPKYECLCDAGWTKEGSNPACNVDIDECSWSRSPCSTNPTVPCFNTPGSYMCGFCPIGYTGNGHSCEDVDECLQNNGGCSIVPMVQCTNTLGSRQCGPCPPGYQGSGMFCSQSNICTSNNGGCHSLAVCLNNPAMVGGRECRCPLGYTGSGEGPYGCTIQSGVATLPPGVQNACETNPCVHGICNAIGTSYHCTCQLGYTGLRCELEINECNSNPCQNGGTCVDRLQGFTCICSSDFTGMNCEIQQSGCGGMLAGEVGILKFPSAVGQHYGLNQHCVWTISTVQGKVLNLTFINFDVEAGGSACPHDFVQINDGPYLTSASIGHFCGSGLPKGGTIIANHNEVRLLFVSDDSITGLGFELHWNTTDPVCGGTLTEDHGFVDSPGFPGEYPHNRDCYWTISVVAGRKILFHFRTLKLEHHDACEYDFLRILDGETENSHVLSQFCSTIEDPPPAPVTTNGNVAVLHFHSDQSGSDAGFHLTYSSIPGIPGCGGLLTNPVGIISSPAHPNNYAHNLDCSWQIRVLPDERIKLTFLEMDVEENDHCLYDYIEIIEGLDPRGNVIDRYCGKSLPRPFTSTGSNLWVKFHTDHVDSFTGFRAEYKIMCGGIFSEPGGGQIHSPNYPHPYPGSRECIYIILQPPGTAIVLEFEDFEVETDYIQDEDCSNYDYLQIRDGDDESFQLLANLCGDKQPAPVMTTHNAMWLKFKTDSSVHNRGFLAKYRPEDIVCGGIFMNETRGTIISPDHPMPYPSGTNCRWIIRAPPGFVIQLTFTSFLLEDAGCFYDYVEIFDNITVNGTGNSMGRYCGRRMPPTKVTFSSTMTIVFMSDDRDAFDGFSASFTTVNGSMICGGNYYTNTGVIRSPNYPNVYPDNRDCTWAIKVAAGQQVRLNITDIDLEPLDNCTYDYLEIRNGADSSSPLIGKYCTIDNTPRIIQSHTNHIFLRFHTDPVDARRGFEIYWDATITGCGGEITASSGSLSSPNYPDHYHDTAVCRWHIAVNPGRTIKIILRDLDIEASDNCQYDRLEFSSRSTRHIAARFCGQTIPEPFSLGTNKLTVKFKTDINTNGRGFNFNYQSECNTKFEGLRRGVIESTNFPDPYSANENCTWIITAPWGNKVHLFFTYLEIDSSTDCQNDFVEVRENDPPLMSYGKICGNTIPAPITSTSESISVRFVSDGLQELSGFRLEWTIIGCGGEILKNDGSFGSPIAFDFGNRIACEWRITVDLGLKVKLTIEKFDLDFSVDCAANSLEIFGGPVSTSPRLAQLCHRSSTSMEFSSLGNHMFVRYRRRIAISGSGFNATFVGVAGGCGGNITSPAGFIQSPNYPYHYNKFDDCTWLITVEPFHTVLLTFSEFETEHEDCNFDYVAVYDGTSEDDNLLLKHCGNTVPSPNAYRSTSNQMLIRFMADGSVQHRGFSAKYSTECGGRINANEGGIVTVSDTSSLYISSTNCTWFIIAENPGDRVTLTFTHFHLPKSRVDQACTISYLRVFDGDSENASAIDTFCGFTVPPAITSQGSALTVKLVRNPTEAVAFSASYFESSSTCGGDYTSDSGSFASPNYPNSYPAETECIWTIQSSPGNRVDVTFSVFELEESEDCNLDYVEIHENDPAGRLLAHTCGKSAPSNVTKANKLWIKFRSDSESTGVGFMAHYYLVYGNELFGTEGQIASPMYPHYNAFRGPISWRVVVPSDMYIQATLEDFSMIRHFTYGLSLFDGEDQDAPLLHRFRSASDLRSVVTTGNQLYVLFRVRLTYRTRFLLSWKAVSEYPTEESSTIFPTAITPSSIPGCGGQVWIHENNATNISSPGFPEGYQRLLNCTWILQARPGHQISLKVLTMDVMGYGYENYCYADFLRVFVGDQGMAIWQTKYDFCRRDNENDYVNSTGHLMKLEFITDYYGNQTGFLVQAQTVCGGYLYDSMGIINSPKYPDIYPTIQVCEWFVTVKPGRTIRINFEDFDIEDSGGCVSDYILFRNGGSKDSPLLAAGKYCGNRAPHLNTTSNYLYVKFVSDNKATQNKGFKLKYEEVSVECGGTVRLSAAIPEYTIQTPGFPSIPPPHTECYWLIMGPSAHRIQLDFDSVFAITNEENCSTEYVAAYDGGSINSHQLLKHCGVEAPGTIWASGNVMLVRYFTDTGNEGAGFKAFPKLAVCGGTIKSSSGRINSPVYPQHYGSNLDCEWVIKGPTGHYLSFTFANMVMPYAYNCSEVDHVEIRDFNSTGEILGTFCGDHRPPSIDTSDNTGYIRFVTKSTTPHLTGFTLTFNASVEECGGELSAPTGIITSPNFPGQYAHHRSCYWKITVPADRRIRLEFTHFNLEETDVYYNGVWYCSDRLMVYNGLINAPRLLPTTICGNVLPEALESSGNTMGIYFGTDGDGSGSGFRAIYSSDEAAICGGELKSFPGNLSTSFPNQAANTSVACIWEVNFDIPLENTSIVLTIHDFNMSSRYDVHMSCYRDFLKILHGSSIEQAEVVYDLCGNLTDQRIFVIPFVSSWWYYVKSAISNSSIGFNLTYALSECGGEINSEAFTLVTPNYPNNYGAEIHCAWAISAEEGNQIKIKIVDFDLDANTKDYFTAYNGFSPANSPRIGLYNGTNKPQDFHSMSNKLWLEFHSDGSGFGRGFKIEGTAEGAGCGGGLHHGDSGTIESLNFPNKYSNNIECIWEIVTAPSYHLNITFVDRFDIQLADSCSKDFVAIYDRVGDDWKQIGSNLCGKQLPSPVKSNSSHVKIMFRSDQYIDGDGFKAQWSRSCGTIYTAESGTIYSPGFPDYYGNNLFCEYLIENDPEHYVVLKFDENFDLENETNCVWDSLEIFRGRTSRNVSLGKFCGNNSPGLISGKGSFLLQFKTDHVVVRSGFAVDYEIQVCGGNLTNTAGIIKSPMMSTNYHQNLNCVWTVRGVEGLIVKLSFTKFEVEEAYNCMYDAVIIYDGDSVSSPRLQKLCGHEIPNVIVSTSNVMTVQFITDDYLEHGGFAAYYMSSYGEQHGCGGTLEAASGTIASVDWDHDGYYEPNLNCFWTIILPDQNKIVKLTFQKFEIEVPTDTSRGCPWDYLEIRDGSSYKSPLIGRFCGSTKPSDAFSSSNTLTVVFVSDMTGNHTGFQASFSSVERICGGTLNVTNQSAVVTSPQYPSNYPNNFRCIWILKANLTQYIQVTFDDFELEESNSCANDYMEISDVTEAYSWRPPWATGGSYCGSKVPHHFQSYFPSMQIIFSSNGAVAKKGFKFRYQLLNCNSSYDDDHGRVRLSIKYSGALTTSNCIFTVNTTANRTISIYFSNFELHWSSNCSEGNLQVRDGNSSLAPLVAQECSYRAMLPVFSTGSTLWFNFTARYGQFDMTYTTTDKGRGCGGTVSGLNGSLSSPLYPSPNISTYDCTWLIQVPPAGSVQLVFLHLDITGNVDANICDINYVAIYDGATTDDGRRIGQYCGQHYYYLTVDATSNEMTVRYVSNTNNTGTGFSAGFRYNAFREILPEAIAKD